MKTLEYWNNEGGDFNRYVKAGDEIDVGIHDYFLCTVPPTCSNHKGFLMGEAATVDPDGALLYMHFTQRDGKFFYVGLSTIKLFMEEKDG